VTAGILVGRDSRVVDEVNAVVQLNTTRRVGQVMTGTVEVQRRQLVAGVTLQLVLSGTV